MIDRKNKERKLVLNFYLLLGSNVIVVFLCWIGNNSNNRNYFSLKLMSKFK